MRVLIVEDHGDSARSLQLYLKLAGYDVRVAASGRAGLAAARDWLPDVVLCDLGLPELNGFEVARALRDDPETAHIRLISVSGYGRPEDRRRSADAGFELHLTKPVDPALIKRLLAIGVGAETRCGL
jgi:CheY-like chemotaxis protein